MIKSFAVTNNLNERLDMVLTEPEESGIVVKSVTGLGPGKATLHIKEIANGDGGSYGGGRIPVRNIVMNLAFLGNPTIEDTRQLTYRFFPLNKPVTLTVLTDNLEVNIDGYVESNEPDIFSNLEGCQVSILCSNPYFYTARDQLTTSNGSVPMFEFPVDNELIENPTTDTRIPSDEPYINYGNRIISAYPDDDIKHIPFSFYHYTKAANGSYYIDETIYGATTENKDGSLPFSVTFEDASGSHNRKSGMFYLRFPFNRNLFDNDKKYTLSFLIDGVIDKQLLGDRLAFVLDLCVYSDRLIYGSGKMQKTDNDYERLPIASYYKKYSPDSILDDHSSENVRVDIPLTKNIIDTIYSYGLLSFYAKGTYIEKNGTTNSKEPVATYGYSMLIHDVTIYENNVEIRDGFAGEKSYLYKWNPYIMSMNKDSNISALLFKVVKEKMEWENTNDLWKPKSSDGKRTFVLEFDIYGLLNKKYNGTDFDYLRLNILYRPSIYAPYKINENVQVCWLSPDKVTTNTIKDYQIEISEDLYYDLINDKTDIYGGHITFIAYYMRRNGGTVNYFEEKPDGGTKIEVSNIRFYEVLQPTSDQEVLNKVYYLIDDSSPDYTFEKDGLTYNLKASEGIIMGEIQKYGFEHIIRYDGNAGIGFQATIEFTHSLVLTNDNGGLNGEPGYIVIKSNYYPNKKIVIDLEKVYEIVQIGGGGNNIAVPITEPGDRIFIDTRKKKKTIRYQKPDNYTYSTPDGPEVWEYAGRKINILAASNRDIEWFELHQGENIFTIYHTPDPEREGFSDEEMEKCHSEYLEVEIRNQVYYEGV